MTILDVSVDSPIWSIPDKKIVRYYFYLLSNAKQLGNEWVVDGFPPHPDASAFFLQQADYLLYDGGTAYLTDNGVLLANKINPLVAEIALLKELHGSIKSRRLKEQADDWYTIILWMEEDVKEHIKNAPQLFDAWRMIYGLIQQEQPRSLLVKEWGQFKTFLKLYDPVVAIKMIVCYIAEATAPNIGELLIKKDHYFHKLFGAKNIKQSEDGYEASF